MDVLVCPSLWNEPFGRVVLDAFKNAMPAIVSNRGALPELVTDCITGKVVRAEKKETLEQAMAEYLESPDTVYQHAVNAVLELKKYSLTEQTNRFVNEAYRGETKE
jgi:glycosyltransferase involved in cell wall biosynthesis